MFLLPQSDSCLHFGLPYGKVHESNFVTFYAIKSGQYFSSYTYILIHLLNRPNLRSFKPRMKMICISAHMNALKNKCFRINSFYFRGIIAKEGAKKIIGVARQCYNAIFGLVICF